MHYCMKSPEEYVDKMRRNKGGQVDYEELVKHYFSFNNFTIEKLKSFENKLNLTFDRDFKIINKFNK